MNPPDPTEEFHVLTRNARAFKRMYAAHDVHYQPYVQQLVATAPLHLDDRPRVALPVGVAVPMALDEAIRARASRREFAERPLPLEQLATVLRLANGVTTTHDIDGQPVFYGRAAANSGGLGSVEVYPVVLDVEGVDAGIYHFDTVRHDLALLHGGDFRDWLRETIVFQLEFGRAAVALVLTAAVGRLRSKYGPRGYRFALLDVGHVSQNVYLVTTALELQMCATAGFIDDDIDRALGIDGLDVATMLVLLVGPTG